VAAIQQSADLLQLPLGDVSTPVNEFLSQLVQQPGEAG
jgi:hypothetical protein